MFDMPIPFERLILYGLLLVPPMALWIGLMFTRSQRRRFEARIDEGMRRADASLEKSNRFQEDVKARSAESKAAQQRGLEIAERAMHDRQEMLELLRRVVALLEARDRP